MSLGDGLYDLTVDAAGNIVDGSGNILTTNTVLTTTASTNTVNAVYGGSYGGTTYGGFSYGNYSSHNLNDTRAINLDKIAELDEEKRKLMLAILVEYNKNTYNQQLFENTLEAYGILEDKDALKRKNKIGDILK